jgi:hypothetical protein
MKRLLLILALALPCWSAITVAHVNGNAGNTLYSCSSPNGCITFTLTVSAGDAILVSTDFYENFTNTISVSDSAGNSWTATAPGNIVNGADNHQDFYVCNAKAGSPDTITVTLSGSYSQNDTIAGVGFDVTGTASSSCVSATNSATYSSSPVTSGTFTINATDVVIASVSSIYGGTSTAGNIGGSASSIPANATQHNGNLGANLQVEYIVAPTNTSGITAAMSLVGTNSGSMIVTALKASGAVAKTCTMTLLGAGPC